MTSKILVIWLLTGTDLVTSKSALSFLLIVQGADRGHGPLCDADEVVNQIAEDLHKTHKTHKTEAMWVNGSTHTVECVDYSS